jgi:HK97 gp10 family phage protein
MKLWVNGKAGSAGSAIRATVKEQVTNINRKVVSRGVRAVNAIRNAELEVLKGQRSGRVYRKPYTKATYTASAPGEPPARRTGNLRMHWNGQVKSENASSGGVAVVAELESQESYAGYLENGTSKMAARPFVEKIKEEATPEIQKIYSEPYT